MKPPATLRNNFGVFAMVMLPSGRCTPTMNQFVS